MRSIPGTSLMGSSGAPFPTPPRLTCWRLGPMVQPLHECRWTAWVICSCAGSAVVAWQAQDHGLQGFLGGRGRRQTDLADLSGTCCCCSAAQGLSPTSSSASVPFLASSGLLFLLLLHHRPSGHGELARRAPPASPLRSGPPLSAAPLTALGPLRGPSGASCAPGLALLGLNHRGICGDRGHLQRPGSWPPTGPWREETEMFWLAICL